MLSVVSRRPSACPSLFAPCRFLPLTSGFLLHFDFPAYILLPIWTGPIGMTALLGWVFRAVLAPPLPSLRIFSTRPTQAPALFCTPQETARSPLEPRHLSRSFLQLIQLPGSHPYPRVRGAFVGGFFVLTAPHCSQQFSRPRPFAAISHWRSLPALIPLIS